MTKPEDGFLLSQKIQHVPPLYKAFQLPARFVDLKEVIELCLLETMTFSYVLLPPFIACLFPSRFGMALHTPAPQERDGGDMETRSWTIVKDG